MPRFTNLAEKIVEPPDGTRLLILDGDSKPTAIWRDDAEASTDTMCGPGEHWFDDYAEPMDWPTILRYAKAVYMVSPEPLATSRPGRKVASSGALLTALAYDAGDPVWIEDGYAGSPHEAKVTAVDHSLLHAEGPRLIGDSRVKMWAIPADQVPIMVKRREVPEV